ncbi:MAG: FmdB family zinc ribbon protein [Candidatus Omnitrophota bacterium]|jgi:putative FmdB family regulatory protein
MPTYDYKCLKCGDKFEAFQKMSDKPLKECPKCKGQVRRLIGSGCGLIFKGKGFYATDYKKSTCSTKAKDEPKVKCSGCDKTKSDCSQESKKTVSGDSSK